MVTVNDDAMSTIQLNGSTITLLGTAHVSKESVELVEAKILSKDFDCVAVELCPARYENLKNRSWWKNLDIYEVFKQPGTFGIPETFGGQSWCGSRKRDDSGNRVGRRE